MATIDDIRAKALKDSLSQFSEKTAGITKLTEEQLKTIIPPGIDQAKLFELIRVVKDASKSNNDKAEAIKTMSGFAEIAANLISHII